MLNSRSRRPAAMDESWAQRKAREIEAQSKVPEGTKPSFFSKFAALVDSGLLKELKPVELRILFALLRFADFDTGTCHPSRETLRALTGCCKDTFADALKELKRRRLVQYKRGSKRVHFKYQYVLLCFRPRNLDQSKDDAFVRELPTKAEDEKCDAFVRELPAKAEKLGPDLLSSENHRFAFVRELPTKNRMNCKEKKEREESSSPPPSSNTGSAPPPQSQTHLGEDKGQELKAVVDDVSNSISKLAERIPVSPFFEKSHKKRVDAGEKAFKEEMRKILSPEEVGEKQP